MYQINIRKKGRACITSLASSYIIVDLDLQNQSHSFKTAQTKTTYFLNQQKI